MQVKCLKNYGLWAKKGKILETSDDTALRLERRGIVKVIKYLGKYDESKFYLKKNIKSAKNQIKVLEQKIKRYEKIMKQQG